MSELFVWSDEFSVGIQEIDEQHKELVALLNELHTSILEHRGGAACRATLDRLAGYTRTHFMVEESLMRIANYPDFEGHKHIHEDLINQVAALQKKLDSGQATITFELLHFLKVWLTQHIKESDKRLGGYLIERGAATQWEPHVKATMAQKKWWWKFW